MTNYSNIVDDEIYLLRDPIAHDTAQRSIERLRLVIDESGHVRLEERTYYGADGTPSDEWHRRTLAYTLATGPCVVDVAQLRADLAEDGMLSTLIDRVIAGHEVYWDGHNMRGRLADDAQDAHEELVDVEWGRDGYVLDGWAVWDAYDWLHGSPAVDDEYLLTSAGLTVSSSREDIKAAALALEIQARNDSVIVIDVEDELEQAIARVKKAAEEEAA